MEPRTSSTCCVTRNHDAYDRLSSLPCDIIHHIFSYLGYNDLARMMVLSKGLYHLGISSPYLYFMVDCLKGFLVDIDSDGGISRLYYKCQHLCESSNIYTACSRKCKEFGNFLLTLMSKRGNAPLRALRLHWLCGNSYHTADIVHKLITHASERDLHEVDLNLKDLFLKRLMPLRIASMKYHAAAASNGIYENASMELRGLVDYYRMDVKPDQLFRGLRSLIDCRSLKVLKLNCIYIYDNRLLSIWISGHAQSLVRLTLYSLKSELHGNNLDIKNSSLKVLELFDVSSDRNITIASPSLESLKMENVHLSGVSYLNITCPSLMDLIVCECKLCGTSSITISSDSLLRLVYSDCTLLLGIKGSYIFYAPNLRDVKISYSQAAQGYQLSSLSYAAPIRKLAAFLKQIIQLHGEHVMGSLLMHTSSLKNLCINNEEQQFNISDAELFDLLRSNPSLVNDEEQLVCLLEEKLNKSMEIFDSNIPK